MKKYAILGWPLKHSLSPQIHNPAFKELGINAEYEKVEINPNNFTTEIYDLKNKNYSGFNITIPHKTKIIPFIDEIDEQAKIVGAVNTICIKNSKWVGYNTDIDGFIEPLLALKRKFDDCVILGTGGAARAVLFALIKYFSPKNLVVAARSQSNARKLLNNFQDLSHGINIDIININDLNSNKITNELIINTTPVGTIPNINDSPLPNLKYLPPSTVVYDLVYNPQETKLLKDARKAGKNITIINGLTMLIGQAAKAFNLWTNKELPRETARKNLIKALN